MSPNIHDWNTPSNSVSYRRVLKKHEKRAKFMAKYPIWSELGVVQTHFFQPFFINGLTNHKKSANYYELKSSFD